MKTNEFIERVKELGYNVYRPSDSKDKYTEVCFRYTDAYGYIYNGDLVANVSETAVKSFSCSSIYFDSDNYELAKLLIEYANTPLGERRDGKKYYVKVFNSFEGFLYVYEDCVMLSARVDDSRGQFTQEDIDELKQRYDIPLDWDKVKLIEVTDNED